MTVQELINDLASLGVPPDCKIRITASGFGYSELSSDNICYDEGQNIVFFDID